MNQTLNYATIAASGNQRLAQQAFEAAFAGHWWRLIWRRLRGKNGRLLDLNRLKNGMNITASTDLGIQLVPIADVVGSEGRSREFTADFRPLQTRTMARWMQVAAATAGNAPLPPVELILIDDRYFVRDGHHRLSVARHFGQTHIEANVTRWVVNAPIFSSANKPEIDWQLLKRLQIR